MNKAKMVIQFIFVVQLTSIMKITYLFNQKYVADSRGFNAFLSKLW